MTTDTSSVTHTLALLRREPVADGTMAFHFARPAGFSFLPGQYVNISLIGPAEPDPAGNLRSFSLVSAPHEPMLTIATRVRASPFKRQLAASPEGAQVRAEGPLGELTLADDERVVLVAGGIGITPFMSMLRHAAHRGSDRAITLIYGNRSPQAAAFMTELDELCGRLPRLRVVHCMSEPQSANTPWSGETGFVTEKLLARHIEAPGDALYYVVGPPAMTAALRDVLMNLGVPDDRVRVEEFAGY